MSKPTKFVQEFWEKYTAYLKSPEWAARRAALFSYKGDRCTAWLEGCTGKATQAHHTKDGYKMPYETPLCELEPVCDSCHRKITAAHRSAKYKRADLVEAWHRIYKTPPSPGAEKSEASPQI